MTADSLELVSRSPEETEQLGARLAPLLSAGTVLALYGDLAAGKTCFVRGLARAFDAGEAVHSPTFTLVNEYGNEHRLYHLDLYRLAGAEGLADLGIEEMLDSGVCAIEWAERAEGTLPDTQIELRFAHAGGDARKVAIHNHGVLAEGWQTRLQPQN